MTWPPRKLPLFAVVYVLLALGHSSWAAVTEEDEGVKYADQCEACKILAIELQERLTETGKSRDVIETGYSVDDVKPKKRTEYKRSELRLIESLENVCDRILGYNLHKERKDSTRFAKGMSQTFQTLHGLVDKGVKVDLGIPYELWDKPSVEVTQMKNQCERLLEQNEEVIENWYYKHQEQKPLIEYLCEERALRGKNTDCLYEVVGEEKEEEAKAEKKKKRKGNRKGDIGEEKEEL